MAATDTDLTATTDALDSFRGENAARPDSEPSSTPPPASGSSSTTSPEDSDEDLVRFNWRSMPGGAITEHIHPLQEERFTISAGEAHFIVNGEERVVGAG